MTLEEFEEEHVGADLTVLSYSTNQVTLLFSKSAVYVHPTPRSKDNISGYLSLSRRPSPTSRDQSASELLLSWVPTTFLGDELHQYSIMEENKSANIKVKTPTSASSSYAFSVPLTEVANLLIKPPRTGWSWGSMVVITVSGVSFPALFFHDDECISTIQEHKRRTSSFDPFGETGNAFWGWDSLLVVLRGLTNIKKSETSPGTYVLNPSLPPALPAAKNGGPSLQWRILEKFSRITNVGRSAADQILDSDAGKEILAKLPPKFRMIATSPQAQSLAKEYDTARLYLAHWAADLSDLSNFTPPSSADEVFEEETSLGMFEVLSSTEAHRRKPIDEAEWRRFFDHKGQLVKSDREIRNALFHGGCDESIMGEVWGFLLGLYAWDSDAATRNAVAASKRDEYYQLKRKWFDTLDEPSVEFEEERNRIEKDIHRTDRQHPFFEHEDMPSSDPTAEWGTNAHMEQLKDILLTYNEYNKGLGYVQGMSDLLAPVYVVSADDGVAFWCFTGLMARMERNFLRDQTGMRLQLMQLTELTHFMLPRLYAHLEKCESLDFFFFYRMLLIIFKREFSFSTILQIWTVLFTNYYTPDFQVFIALAIMDLHADIIITHLRAYDEVLKYINELSGRMKVDEVLQRAEKLYLAFQGRVRELEKREAKRRNRDRNSTDNANALSENLQRLLGAGINGEIARIMDL